MILFLDTETTCLPDFKSPSDAAHQPHLCQLAMLLTDWTGNEMGRVNAIIRPEGWVIPDAVAAIHGITTERAMADGIPEAEAVAAFVRLREEAKLRVGHNVGFDDRIMRIAMMRHGQTRDQIEAMERGPKFCTMNASKHLVNIPPTDRMKAAGFHKPKPPKLTETYSHFFGREFDGAHDAMNDAMACRDVFFELGRRGHGPESAATPAAA